LVVAPLVTQPAPTADTDPPPPGGEPDDDDAARLASAGAVVVAARLQQQWCGEREERQGTSELHGSISIDGGELVGSCAP
jgi:hypothetical protein